MAYEQGRDAGDGDPGPSVPPIPARAQSRVLQTFIVQLGAAMTATGRPAYEVQQRLTVVARAYGARGARVSAFPTYMMVAMGRGAPATLEITPPLSQAPRLDQIAAIDLLLHDAERAEVSPVDGLGRLQEIRDLAPRYGVVRGVMGYAILTMGLCLVLHPAAREVAAAAVLGALVGGLTMLGRPGSPLTILMPVIAAFAVSILSATAVKHGWTDPGLRAMVASLIVFLPGATLTTAVLELAAGQMIAGSSRLVFGAMQLALLAFGILAGVEAAGVPSHIVFSPSGHLLGAWAPWLGVLVFAIGVTIADSAPPKSFPTLLIVLYAAWTGQVIGNVVFGGYVSAFVGAAVMTPIAFWVTRLPHAMPSHASFLPGFWLLVPGALGLAGLAEFAGDARTAGLQDLAATIVSIFAVALGILIGTLLHDGAGAGRRAIGDVSNALVRRTRKRPRKTGPPPSGPARM